MSSQNVIDRPVATVADRDARDSAGRRAVRLIGRYGTPGVFVLLLIVFGILEGGMFFSVSNFVNVLVQSVIPIVIALGLTIILLVGEFDLSIGYNASLAGVLTASLYSGPLIQKVLVLLLVIAVGALIGFLNGIIVTKLGVNALVATLGVGSLVVGANYLVTRGSPLTLKSDGTELTNVFLSGIGPVPWVIIIAAAVAVVMWLVLNRTTLGLEIKAVGGNRVASELSGIRAHRVIIMSFMIGGAFAAIGGILLTANVGSGQVVGGDGYLLSSFAACFLGSAVLRDGEFHTVGTVVGVLTITIGFNGLAIYGVGASAQFFFQGALLIAAVGMSTAARRIIMGRRIGH
ncbi:ABC transporter permease [Cryobacterium suzukii]|uniref:ABC transporter permease n=1 Tax=Cryobacterium suzukii TaxID=1259198 RepID=A0A4R9AGD6_9MICO|nr:ABC transporter permease [Cryobacterium suzukii]TFD61498.1 ABC transporter permease [Cryobacterium suzukii]